jgi:hypothetical protein
MNWGECKRSDHEQACGERVEFFDEGHVSSDLLV